MAHLTGISQGVMLFAVAMLALAALHDIAFRTLPDWLSVVLFGCGILLRASAGELAAIIVPAMLVAGAAFGLWHLGWLGGGDAKLFIAVATLVPPGRVFEMLLLVSLAGGGLALLFLALRLCLPPPTPIRPIGLFRRVLRAEAWRLRRGGPLPYAVAIASGTAFTLFTG